MDFYGLLSSGKGPNISNLFILMMIYYFEVSCSQQVCFVCNHVRDFSSCQQNVRVCPPGEICFTSETLSNYGFLVYSSGCASKQTCDTLSINSLEGPNKQTSVRPNNIIGKRTTRSCYCCCANEGDMYRLCNKDRCSMQMTSRSTTRSIGITSSTFFTTTSTPVTTTPFSSMTNRTASRTHPSSTLSTTEVPTLSTTKPTSNLTPPASSPVSSTSSTSNPTSPMTTPISSPSRPISSVKTPAWSHSRPT
ncbi:uncharacterized protein LOC134259883 [Saccostrea cucullata]|uniref:uncharacterized protein LOC134259883 n=1 Tax=Saccostrea cuccullata TaxID=36930 RepID=UPI002ED1ECDE